MTPIPPRPTTPSMRQPANSRPETRSATGINLVGGFLYEHAKYPRHSARRVRLALAIGTAAVAQDALDSLERAVVGHVPARQLHRLSRELGHAAQATVTVEQTRAQALARRREHRLLDRLAVEPGATVASRLVD